MVSRNLLFSYDNTIFVVPVDRTHGTKTVTTPLSVSQIQSSHSLIITAVSNKPILLWHDSFELNKIIRRTVLPSVAKKLVESLDSTILAVCLDNCVLFYRIVDSALLLDISFDDIDNEIIVNLFISNSHVVFVFNTRIYCVPFFELMVCSNNSDDIITNNYKTASIQKFQQYCIKTNNKILAANVSTTAQDHATVVLSLDSAVLQVYNIQLRKLICSINVNFNANNIYIDQAQVVYYAGAIINSTFWYRLKKPLSYYIAKKIICNESNYSCDQVIPVNIALSEKYQTVRHLFGAFDYLFEVINNELLIFKGSELDQSIPICKSPDSAQISYTIQTTNESLISKFKNKVDKAYFRAPILEILPADINKNVKLGTNRSCSKNLNPLLRVYYNVSQSYFNNNMSNTRKLLLKIKNSEQSLIKLLDKKKRTIESQEQILDLTLTQLSNPNLTLMSDHTTIALNAIKEDHFYES